MIKNNGILYMGSTHLGDERDVPQRTLFLLKSVDLLVGEESRPLRQLCRLGGLHRSFRLYNEHHQKETLEAVKTALSLGQSVLYIPDQGSSNSADPGHRLVLLAHSLGAQVRSIPGPCSISSAIAVCPFQISSYLFLGFLPQKREKRIDSLKKALKFPWSLVLLETPYRWQDLLTTLDTLPEWKKREGFLVLDISGDWEDSQRGPWQELKKWHENKIQSAGCDLNGVLIIPPFFQDKKKIEHSEATKALKKFSYRPPEA